MALIRLQFLATVVAVCVANKLVANDIAAFTKHWQTAGLTIQSGVLMNVILGALGTIDFGEQRIRVYHEEAVTIGLSAILTATGKLLHEVVVRAFASTSVALETTGITLVLSLAHEVVVPFRRNGRENFINECLTGITAPAVPHVVGDGFSSIAFKVMLITNNGVLVRLGCRRVGGVRLGVGSGSMGSGTVTSGSVGSV